MAQDGHTYERVCIEEWFQTGARTSPQTNEPLESTKLVPNHALRKMVATFLRRRARRRLRDVLSLRRRLSAPTFP